MIFPCLAYADLMDPSPTLTLHPVVRFTLARDSFFFLQRYCAVIFHDLNLLFESRMQLSIFGTFVPSTKSTVAQIP